MHRPYQPEAPRAVTDPKYSGGLGHFLRKLVGGGGESTAEPTQTAAEQARIRAAEQLADSYSSAAGALCKRLEVHNLDQATLDYLLRYEVASKDLAVGFAFGPGRPGSVCVELTFAPPLRSEISAVFGPRNKGDDDARAMKAARHVMRFMRPDALHTITLGEVSEKRDLDPKGYIAVINPAYPARLANGAMFQDAMQTEAAYMTYGGWPLRPLGQAAIIDQLQNLSMLNAFALQPTLDHLPQTTGYERPATP